MMLGGAVLNFVGEEGRHFGEFSSMKQCHCPFKIGPVQIC